jgi:cathepsin S
LAALEGQIRKKFNKTVHLSVQQLTDCSSNEEYGNYGCDGGNFW